jgi:hypothetical protein
MACVRASSHRSVHLWLTEQGISYLIITASQRPFLGIKSHIMAYVGASLHCSIHLWLAEAGISHLIITTLQGRFLWIEVPHRN